MDGDEIDGDIDDDHGGRVSEYKKERRRLWGQEGKDLCIIKQAPKDAALLACLSCAIRTIRVIIRLCDTYNTCNTLGDTYNTCNTHHQTNRKKTMRAANIKAVSFSLTRFPRIVVAWKHLCQCMQRLS